MHFLTFFLQCKVFEHFILFSATAYPLSMTPPLNVRHVSTHLHLSIVARRAIALKSYHRRKAFLSTAMASLTLSSLHLRPPIPSASSARSALTSVHPISFAKPPTTKSLRLGWSHSISSFPPLISQKQCSILNLSHNLKTLTIVAAKGYKMKTHKVSSFLVFIGPI